VLPRHTAILGTTGGGKSTTVAGLVQQAQAAGMAVILLDVEGEYTHLHEPTDNPRMIQALRERRLEPAGVPADRMTPYNLVGRETTNPRHPHRVEFALQFARLSPYAVIEMLGMNDAQAGRFHYAYEVAKALLRDLGIFPEKGKPKEEADRQEKLLLRIDEFERGHPRLTLSLLLDVVGKCLANDPGRRYSHMAALAADLRRHLEDLPLAGVRNRSLVERWQKWRRRGSRGPRWLGC